MAVLDHLDGARDLVDVAGDAHHVQHAVLLFPDILAEIRPAHVRHDGEFHVRFVFADDRLQVLFVAELVLAEFGRVEQRLGRLVAHLHIIDARLDVHRVQRLGKFIRKLKIVAKPAVAQRRVQHLDVRTEGQERALSLYICHAISSSAPLRGS